jgi:hypothetical protein
VLDRASSFAREDVIAMLRDDFVPVALDVWYEERRQDEVGGFYRRIVAARPGMEPGRTTQGFYIVRPDGSPVRGWNNRDPDKLLRFLREARNATGRAEPGGAAEAGPKDPPAPLDRRFARRPPEGGAVVEVFARITAADWPDAARGWIDEALRGATARDHLWLTADEIRTLAAAELPPTLARRIARFHLVDNTRGEPPMWRSEELRDCDLELRRDADGLLVLGGRVRLASSDGERSCAALVRAEIEVEGEALTRFDLVARCAYRGEGTYTRGAPPGTFTLVVAARLAAGGEAAGAVPPQGARDLGDYLRAR